MLSENDGLTEMMTPSSVVRPIFILWACPQLRLSRVLVKKYSYCLSFPQQRLSRTPSAHSSTISRVGVLCKSTNGIQPKP